MKLLISKKAVLFRVNLLVALFVLMAILKTALLTYHLHEQRRSNDQINNYFTPLIYYTGKLIETIHEIGYSYQLYPHTMKERESITYSIDNSVYLIQSYLDEIKSHDTEENSEVIKNSRLRLERDINKLIEVMNEFSLGLNAQIDFLPVLIQSADLRAQQFSRLLINVRGETHHELMSQSRNKTALVIQLIVVTVILAALMIIPLVMSIRKMINEIYLSGIKQRKLKELAEQEQSRLAALLSAMKTGILFEDKRNRVEYINPAFKHMWALDKNRPLTGLPLNQLLEASPHRFSGTEHASNDVLQTADSQTNSRHFEINFNDGQIFTQSSYPVLDNNKEVLGRLWVFEDITHERQTARQLLYLAEHDPLSGLYNRHCFQKHLTMMIDRCRRENGKFSLLYFDLDEFKYINDSFGHGSGDIVLIRAANTVATLVRGTDIFARLGGDEFAILTTLESKEKLSVLPERIITAISAIPFRFGGSNLRITASIGIANYPEHGDNAEDLVAHADTAMYEAKKMGKNRWTLYNPERNSPAIMVERMNWSRRIDLVLERDLLVLYFQGVYRTDDHGLSHLEVLVRMRDPADHNRIIMPNVFIPFAEKTAQIVEIDRMVLSKSIATLAQYPCLPALAVNISGRSLDEPSLPLYIREQLTVNAVDPQRLIIELTETEAVTDIQDAQRFIEAIHQTGCRICLDDFGNGFSTFTYLKYLNVQILKIDGMFVRDLVENYENQVFVKAMVSIAQGLGKLIVAEFVENTETLALLKSFGVQFVQGYCLDRPTDQHKAFYNDAIQDEMHKAQRS